MSQLVAKPDFDLKPIEIIKLAWSKLDGTKLPFFLAVVAIFAFTFVISIVASQVGLPEIVSSLVLNFVNMLIMASMFKMALDHLAGKEISGGDALYYLKGNGPVVAIILAGIVSPILIAIGLFLFILPGIYLLYSYSLTFPLIIDRNLSFWDAMESSRKALGKKFFPLIGLFLLFMIISIIAIIPLGIGIIWSTPLIYLSIAIVYDQVFGISNNS